MIWVLAFLALAVGVAVAIVIEARFEAWRDQL